MFTRQDILDIAIRLEENGERTYLAACAHAPVQDLQALLTWIAGEERNHAKWFGELKDRLEKGEDHALMAEFSQALVEDVVQGQTFSLQEVDFTAIASVDEMIRTFIGFEDDTVAFYELLKSFINDPPTAAQLDAIIAEEKKHIDRFRQMLGG
jgi:rubrerythrin